jgi:preprotein translocase subunit SecA
MLRLLDSVFAPSRHDASDIRKINAMRLEFDRLNDDELHALARRATSLLQWFAVTAVVVSRSLGQDMFDVQLRGALALTRGSIAEMQTGEGKTLAAVPAVAWTHAREGVSM